MTRNPVAPETIAAQLSALGVRPGGVLVVHSSFSGVGPVENGPHGFIQGLRRALGAQGTLVMPSMSDDDEHAFDPGCTPCLGMGIVAETFWRLPGVSRSDSPHAFAAIGPHASAITAPHPVDIPHGMNSPIGRAHDLDAQVLLAGVGHDANTAIHLAELLAGVGYRVPKRATVLVAGRPTTVDYHEIDHCCANFACLDAWLDASALQSRGMVGHAPARLARVRDVVDTARSRLRENQTAFLHDHGICAECDAARESLQTTARPKVDTLSGADSSTAARGVNDGRS